MMPQQMDVVYVATSVKPDEALLSLDSIRKNTETHHYHLIIINDNAGSEMHEMLVGWCNEFKPKGVTLIRNQRRHGFLACVNEASLYRNGEFLVALHPLASIADKRWVSKLMMPFKDRACALVAVDDRVTSSTCAPVQLTQKDRTIGDRLFAFRLGKDQKNPIEESLEVTQMRLLRSYQKVYLTPSVEVFQRPGELAKPRFSGNVELSVAISR